MLLGTFLPKLDDKGRVILPAKFRDEFAGGLVMTRGNDGCVFVYSEREFEKLHARMEEQAPKLDDKGRAYIRMFLGAATQEVPDKQSRVTIPPLLRKYAGLERDLAFVGTGAKAEIWDAAAWETYSAQAETEFSNAAGEVIAGIF